MASESRRFLLGKGESLAEDDAFPRRKPTKQHVYDLADARARLAGEFSSAADYFDALPAAACPGDEVTAMMVLHPAYIAKSYWPGHLVDGANLRSVGSRPIRTMPRKVIRSREIVDNEEEAETVALFLAGRREVFHGLAERLPSIQEETTGAEDVIKVESLKPMTPESRLKPIPPRVREPLLEVVLHADLDRPYILHGFAEYLAQLGIDWDRSHYQVDGLCFCPVRSPRGRIQDIARFSFVRVVRGMPKLRSFRPVTAPLRTSGAGFACELPDVDPMNPDIRAAIFDAGLPAKPNLSRWTRMHDGKNVGKASPSYLGHGLAVTSSVLFGPIDQGQPLSQPPGSIDHYRIVDSSAASDPNLYEVISEIESILRSSSHEFINLSIGPDLPVEDDDVHLWGVVLDKYLSTGQALATVAVGNNGEQDRASGLARVLVPADSVHALAVGACDTLDASWQRASYSCVGPGRCPGMVKPEVVHFGGSDSCPFHVLGVGDVNAVGTMGTSVASPYVLRTAMGIRARMGNQLTPLGLKALLINRTESNGSDIEEIGWGRIPEDIDQLLTCDECEARVVFQGRLRPGCYMRVPIPFPSGPVQGMVEVTATFCFACPTDPQDAANYTRSGLEITFRPHSDRRTNPTSQYPDSRPFFSQGDFQGESDRRRGAHKWETTLHKIKRFRATSLQAPSFHIHHGAREKGHVTRSAEEIPYALVLNLRANKDNTLYNRTVTQYRTHLQVMQPVLQVPIPIRE